MTHQRNQRTPHPPTKRPPRPLTDAEAALLAQTVRTRRAFPRAPAAAFWLRIFADALLLGALVFFFVPMFGRSAMTPTFYLAPAACFVLWFALRFAANRVSRRLRRHVLGAGGLACINCHYPLPAADPRTTAELVCPECREPYRDDEVRKQWSQWQPGVWFY